MGFGYPAACPLGAGADLHPKSKVSSGIPANIAGTGSCDSVSSGANAAAASSTESSHNSVHKGVDDEELDDERANSTADLYQVLVMDVARDKDTVTANRTIHADQLAPGMLLRAIFPLAANDASAFQFATGAVVEFRRFDDVGDAVVESQDSKRSHFVFRERLLTKFERIGMP